MAWASGGVGSWFWEAAPLSWAEGALWVEGAVSMDWRARQVVKILSMVDCAVVGGLAGGDAKRVDWRRVAGDRDESHESAEGINMLTGVGMRNGVRGCVRCLRRHGKENRGCCVEVVVVEQMSQSPSWLRLGSVEKDGDAQRCARWRARRRRGLTVWQRSNDGSVSIQDVRQCGMV